jgi:hypothetical protein
MKLFSKKTALQVKLSCAKRALSVTSIDYSKPLLYRFLQMKLRGTGDYYSIISWTVQLIACL